MSAITKLGKYLNINVEEQMSTDVPSGQVISQDPAGFTDDEHPTQIRIMIPLPLW